MRLKRTSAGVGTQLWVRHLLLRPDLMPSLILASVQGSLRQRPQVQSNRTSEWRAGTQGCRVPSDML